MLLPFALPHLKRDWPALRAKLPLMLALSATGFAFNNAISYWALQYTEALNALLIQSSGPLFVALWSLVLFGVRLTLAQFAGIILSLIRRARHHPARRSRSARRHPLQPRRPDVRRRGALFRPLFGADAVPAEDAQLSLITFTIGCGAVLLLPFSLWEYFTRRHAESRMR